MQNIGKSKKYYFPANYNIRVNELFVVDATGRGRGVMSREAALKLAQEAGLDLVLVNQQAQPPVARIIDLQKFIYEKQQRWQEARKKSRRGSEVKRIRLRPNIAPHDLEIKIRRIRDFLTKGYKIKITVQFFGRQITHKEIGEEKLNQVLAALKEECEIEKEPWFEGKKLMVIIRPKN